MRTWSIVAASFSLTALKAIEDGRIGAWTKLADQNVPRDNASIKANARPSACITIQLGKLIAANLLGSRCVRSPSSMSHSCKKTSDRAFGLAAV